MDKVLDITRLHELLKSVKAIFEIPHVYYLLSISEDALGTYRLRHVETKNEIDSAFTHIFSIPPMDARTELAFFLENGRTWSTQLLPAAIVFGGGVPRDMHRLSQYFSAYPEWESLDDCLDALLDQDREAAIELIQMNPNISIEWRHEWIGILNQLRRDNMPFISELFLQLNVLTLENFLQKNLYSEEIAKRTFHQFHSLISGLNIKACIYELVSLNPTPLELNEWPQDKQAYLHDIPAEVDEWVEKLEPLRRAIFNLSANPLGVYKEVQELAKFPR